MQKWEYTILNFEYERDSWRLHHRDSQEVPNWKGGSNVVETCNKLGQEGWEMVSVVRMIREGVRDEHYYLIYMKRPLP
jgi:hypothetical protein